MPDLYSEITNKVLPRYTQPTISVAGYIYSMLTDQPGLTTRDLIVARPAHIKATSISPALSTWKKKGALRAHEATGANGVRYLSWSVANAEKMGQAPYRAFNTTLAGLGSRAKAQAPSEARSAAALKRHDTDEGEATARKDGEVMFKIERAEPSQPARDLVPGVRMEITTSTKRIVVTPAEARDIYVQLSTIFS